MAIVCDGWTFLDASTCRTRAADRGVLNSSRPLDGVHRAPEQAGHAVDRDAATLTGADRAERPVARGTTVGKATDVSVVSGLAGCR